MTDVYVENRGTSCAFLSQHRSKLTDDEDQLQITLAKQKLFEKRDLRILN
jgi:hypothetical protein